VAYFQLRRTVARWRGEQRAGRATARPEPVGGALGGSVTQA